MPSKLEDLEALKVVIRALLIADKRSLTLGQFLGAYQESEGKNFPFRYFGFSDALSFLRSIPDTVSVAQSGRDVYVRATVTDEVAHVDKMVRRQRDSYRCSRSPLGKRSSKYFRPAFLQLRASLSEGPVLTTTERVKKNVRELLTENPVNGIDVRQFEELYFEKFGTTIGHQAFGYFTFEEFLVGMSDVLSLSWSSPGVMKAYLNGAISPSLSAQKAVQHFKVHQKSPTKKTTMPTRLPSPRNRKPHQHQSKTDKTSAQPANSNIHLADIRSYLQSADMTPLKETTYSWMAGPPELHLEEEEDDWDAEVMAETSVRGVCSQLQAPPAISFTSSNHTLPERNDGLQTPVQGACTQLQQSPVITFTSSNLTAPEGTDGVQTPVRGACTQLQQPPVITFTSSNLTLPECTDGVQTPIQGACTQLQQSPAITFTSSNLTLPECTDDGVRTSVQGVRTQLQVSPAMTFTHSKHTLPECTNSVQTSVQGIRTELQPSPVSCAPSNDTLPECTNGVQTTLPEDTNGVQTSESGLSPQLEKAIKQVLLKNSGGIWLSDFATVYQEVTGRELVLSDHGFSNIMQLMEKCTDILYITRPCPKGDFMVCPHTLDEPMNTKMVAAFELILRSSGSQGMTVDELLEAYQEKTGMLIRPSDLGFTRQTFVVFLASNVHMTYESLGRGQFVLKWHDDLEAAARIRAGVTAAAEAALAAGTSGMKRTARGTLAAQATCVDHAFQRALAEAQIPFEYFGSPPLDLPQNPFRLQEGLSETKYCAVYVSQVYGVDHFYLQLKGSATSLRLEKLMLKMEVYDNYDAKEKIPANEVCVGTPCAVPYTYSDGTSDWHRGLVVAVNTYPPLCQVLYVDYGTLAVVPKKKLRYLRDEFFDLPAQAIRARMGHLDPMSPSGWTPESKAFFIKLATVDYALMCKVFKKEGPVYSIGLCDTFTEPEMHFSDCLVDKGYARLCFEDAASTMESHICSSIPRAEGTQASPEPMLSEHFSLSVRPDRHILTDLTQPGNNVPATHSAEPAYRMPRFETGQANQSTKKGRRTSHGEGAEQSQPGNNVPAAHSAEPAYRMPRFETGQANQSTKKGRRTSHGEGAEQSGCEAAKRSEATKQSWSLFTGFVKEQACKISHAEKTGQTPKHDHGQATKRGCSFPCQAIEQGSMSRQIWTTETPQKAVVNGQAQKADSSAESGQAHMFRQFCTPSQAEIPDRCHTPSPMQAALDIPIQPRVKTRVPMDSCTNQLKEGCQPTAADRAWTEDCCQPTGQIKITSGAQSLPLARTSPVPPVCQKSPTPVEPFVGPVLMPAVSSSALQNSVPVGNTSSLQSLERPFAEQLLQAAASSDGDASIQALDRYMEPSASAAASVTASQQTEGTRNRAASSPSDEYEDFMVVLQRELDGPLPSRSVKPEYLKTGHCLMILNYLQEAYISSANVCQLLDWTSDEILQKLEEKHIEFPLVLLRRIQNGSLFNQMASYEVPGVKIRQQLAEQVFFFPLKNVIDLLNLFERPSKRLRQEVARVFNSFDPTSDYWRSMSDDSDTENLSALEEELARLRAQRKELHRAMVASAVDGRVVDELSQIEEKIAKAEVLKAQKGGQPSLAGSKKFKHRPCM